MLIDLTYKCSMGCTHCISDCNENGNHMSIQTLKDVLEFSSKNEIKSLIFSGGEMFENPDILPMLDLIADYCIKKRIPFSLTTNGRLLSTDEDMYQKMFEIKKRLKKEQFLIQVTDDDRYYPSSLNKKQIYRLEKLGCIVERVPYTDIHNRDCCLYPQGRAVKNFTKENFNTKAPKCINCRLLTKQIFNLSFKKLNEEMFIRQKMCTPCVDPDGNIKLGESRLCPVASNIYKNDKEIMNDILNFECFNCEIPLERLKETNYLAYLLIKKQ